MRAFFIYAVTQGLLPRKVLPSNGGSPMERRRKSKKIELATASKRKRLTDAYGILPATRPWPGMKRARELYSADIGREYVRENKPRD